MRSGIFCVATTAHSPQAMSPRRHRLTMNRQCCCLRLLQIADELRSQSSHVKRPQRVGKIGPRRKSGHTWCATMAQTVLGLMCEELASGT